MTQMTIAQAIELGWQHHQQGRLAEAEKIYRQVLAGQPNQPDAIQLLGVLASQVGKNDLAINLIRQAISLNPNEGLYYSNLGQVFSGIGQFDNAISAFLQAVKLRPDMVQAKVNLGNAYLGKGDADRAIICYREAIQINPNLPEPYNNLGNALRNKNQLDEAIESYHRALGLKPDLAEAHYNLAITLKDKKLFAESIQSFRRAIELRPQYPEALNNLGNVYQALQQLPEAEVCFRQAIAQRPNFPNAYNNLGNAVRDQGRLHEAIEHYRRAIEDAPGWMLPHYNYSLTLLLQGNFEPGWQEHEARRTAPEIDIYIRDYSKPSWDGGDLRGKTILIHDEQGFGDAIQFCRYIPMVADRGGRVIFQCHAQLARLFRTLAGVDQIITREQAPPEFDLHCPLLSLPLLFKTTSINDIPANIPYLSAERDGSKSWRRRLETYSQKLKVGLVWSGRVHPPGRSVSMDAFAPLAKVPGVALVSLQHGAPADQANNPPLGMSIINASDEIKDFTDTAAVLENIDLLITIDTAAAHLAGAMGKAVWVLLPWMPDWRWLMERQDTPWYPSMRLYRQPSPGNFQTPIQTIAAHLLQLADSR